MSYFQDKVIAIMGGEGGMGSATAWLLALQGARVSIADYEIHPEKDFRNRDACKMLGEIKKSIVDIRKEHIVKLWIEKTVSDFGKIDGFVNFAGIVSKDFLNNDVECINNTEWQRTMDINLTGTMNCLKAVIPRMNRGSSIVNVSSVLGQGGIPKGSDYGASKAGVISITKCAARELAGKGIRINAIAPGSIDTPMMQGSLGDFECVLGAPWEKIIPLGRMGKAEEVADLVEFLLSNKSTYITGSVVNIDGGFGA